MAILATTEGITALVGRHPQHAKLFWCAWTNQDGGCSIYSVQCDEDQDDGWNIDSVILAVAEKKDAEAIVNSHNACVVAAVSADS